MTQSGNLRKSTNTGDVCCACGKPFTKKIRRCFVENDTLFGGTDKICRQCVKRSEKNKDEVIKEINSKGR